MNNDLLNTCASIYIAEKVGGFIFLLVVCVGLIIIGIYATFTEWTRSNREEEARKKYWDHIKEVQDRFKDNDLRGIK